jgi:gluconate 2-dehydrogenase alpha chain
MATRLKEVDAVMVGMGWTGSIMARELTKAGLTVLGLERGEDLSPRENFALPAVRDELRYSYRLELIQDPALETVTFRHRPSESALPMRRFGSFLPGNSVGGAANHWGGQHWRYLPSDHRTRSHIVERYGAQAIPDDMPIQDWAMTYDELEPTTTNSTSCAVFPGRPATCAARRSRAETPLRDCAAMNIPRRR